MNVGGQSGSLFPGRRQPTGGNPAIPALGFHATSQIAHSPNCHAIRWSKTCEMMVQRLRKHLDEVVLVGSNLSGLAQKRTLCSFHASWAVLRPMALCLTQPLAVVTRP